jgi:hypothetical protein
MLREDSLGNTRPLRTEYWMFEKRLNEMSRVYKNAYGRIMVDKLL